MHVYYQKSFTLSKFCSNDISSIVLMMLAYTPTYLIVLQIFADQ